MYNILVNDDGSCDIYVCISAHTRFEGILEGMEDSDEGPDLTIGSERMRGSNFVAKQWIDSWLLKSMKNVNWRLCETAIRPLTKVVSC